MTGIREAATEAVAALDALRGALLWADDGKDGRTVVRVRNAQEALRAALATPDAPTADVLASFEQIVAEHGIVLTFPAGWDDQSDTYVPAATVRGLLTGWPFVAQPEPRAHEGLDVAALDAINARINRGIGEGSLAAVRWRDALIEVGGMVDDLINGEAGR